MGNRTLKITIILIIVLFIATSFSTISYFDVQSSYVKSGINHEIKPMASVGAVYSIRVGTNPRAIAFDSANGYLYVANYGSHNVTVINSTDSVVNNIPVGINPKAATFDSSNTDIYIANCGSNNLTVINSTNNVTANIRVGLDPDGIAFDSFNKYVYVANCCSNNTTVINNVNKVVANVSVGSDPCGVAFDPLKECIYVVNENSSNVTLINNTNKVAGEVTVGAYPEGVAYDPVNGYVYVADSGPDNVAVINPINNVVGYITVGTSPDAIAYDPLNGYMYVANFGSHNVTVINSQDNVVSNIGVGKYPRAVAFDSLNGNVYVANFGSNNISVIPPTKYPAIFTESGLPSGTPWSVNINGVSYTSTSNQISASLFNGSYNATINSPSGYFPSPSKYIFAVKGESTQYCVTYVFSVNETYINYRAIVYPDNSQVLPGYTINTSYFSTSSLSFGIAYDSFNDLLFIPEMASFSVQGVLHVFNVTTGRFAKNISLPAYDALYDQYTGNVYTVSLSGNISEIDPSTFTILKNVTDSKMKENLTTLQEQGGYLYALSNNGIITQINASTMSIIKTVEVLPHIISYIPLFAVKGENAYVANETGNSLTIVNLTTYKLNQVKLPSNYTPMTVVQYYGSDMLVGGMNYSNELYNITTGSLSTGPNISGVATSSTYNYISGTVYIFSANGESFFGSIGNVTAVNPVNSKVLSRIPGVIVEFSAIFIPNTQTIYAAVYFGIVPEYSTLRYYSVTFTESGLPTGVTWYVNLTDGQTFSSTTSTLSFAEENGSYPYTIATSDKTYKPSSSSGSFIISGAMVSKSVAFSEVKYKVTFTESGLPAGVTWYVNLTDGQTFSSTTNTISFSETNGTYSYSIGKISGYNISKSSGSLTVSGKNVTESITFSSVPSTTPPPKKPSPSSNTDLYIIIGAVAAAAVVGAVVTIMMRKRK